MSTHDWMKSEFSAQKVASKTAGRRPMSPLELALMAAGVVAWGWCAYEVALLLFK
ncbi:MAG: hypothetical protein JSR86_22635 [Proteobacteria bacterium]|nr:hypothetical protein [Pseudomonadota bacterium]